MFENTRIIILDLDNTLHDYERSSKAALGRIFDELKREHGIPPAALEAAYSGILREAIAKPFVVNKTSHEYRRERFTRLLQHFGLPYSDKLLEKLLEGYESELQKNIRPADGLHETLKVLSAGKRLFLATQGPEDAQLRTIGRLGIGGYFSGVFTSGKTGKKKADGELFEHIITELNCDKKETVVVGDSYTSDVLGAEKAGLTAVWLNPDGKKAGSEGVIQIKRLEELIGLFSPHTAG